MKRIYIVLIAAGATVVAAMSLSGVTAMYSSDISPSYKAMTPEIAEQLESGKLQQAVFAAGCFWGVEDRLMAIDGVVATEAGYTGGNADSPSYKLVCSGSTGHAEAVRVIFDPSLVSYDALLDAFFKLHDPTTPNRQGWDVGDQYRSAIFFYSPEQETAARAKIAELTERKTFGRPIVTEVAPAGEFWRAEEYHQKYHIKHGGSCMR